MTRSLCAALCLVGSLAFFGQEAAAHRKLPSRDLLVQWDQGGAAAVVRFSASGKEAALLWATHDLNRDGQIDAKEGRLLALIALKKAVAGVEINVDKKGPLAWDVAGAKWQLARVEPESVEVHGVMEWDSESPSGNVIVGVGVKRGYGPVALSVQTLAPWVVTGAGRVAVAGDQRGLAGTLHLHPGEFLAIDLGRKEGE